MYGQTLLSRCNDAFSKQKINHEIFTINVFDVGGTANGNVKVKRREMLQNCKQTQKKREKTEILLETKTSFLGVKKVVGNVKRSEKCWKRSKRDKKVMDSRQVLMARQIDRALTK